MKLMQVLRFAANNITDYVLVQQQKGWVLWVIVKCWLCSLNHSKGNFNESIQKGTKLCKFRGLGKENKEVKKIG